MAQEKHKDMRYSYFFNSDSWVTKHFNLIWRRNNLLVLNLKDMTNLSMQLSISVS